MAPALVSPRLQRLASRPAERAPSAAQEQCELCGLSLPAEHRHVVDLQTRRLLCACRACSLLLDHQAAGGGHYRLVPERRLRLDSFELSDSAWDSLRIPVDMAFFFEDSARGRVTAFYPGPMGATESQLELGAWRDMEEANPVLETMRPDVEALLVNRSKGARRAWLVPVEDPYRLVALIRSRWRGLAGGKEVWLEIERFFADLDRRAHPSDKTTAEPPAERSR